MSQTQEQPTIPQPEELLERYPINFPLSVLNYWAQAHKGIRFKQFEQNEKEEGQTQPVSVRKNGEDTVVALPRNPTLKDILHAAQLVGPPEEKETQTLLGEFSRNLKNSAILLTKDSVFSNNKFNPLIEFLYNLGQTLEIKSKDVSATTVPLTMQEIAKYEIEYSSKGRSEKDKEGYIKDLWLFLLGKNIRLDPNFEDEKLGRSPTSTAYYYLNKRYRHHNKLSEVPDTQESREKFDNWLFTHASLIKESFSDYVLESLAEGRGRRVIEQLVEQGVFHHLEEVIAEEGRKKLEKYLGPPPLTEDFGEDLREKLKDIFGEEWEENFRNQQTTLFKAAEKLINRLTKEDKNTTKDKIFALWDLVQAYKYAKTYKPSSAIETREMECALRNYVLGTLYQRYLTNEVAVLVDNVIRHTRLIAVEKNTVDKKSPVVYFVDPTYSRYDYARKVREPGFSPDASVQQIKDRQFVNRIIEAYRKNPDEILLRLQLEETPDIEKFHSVGSFQRLSLAILWNNLARFVETPEERRVCYQKSNDLDPNYVGVFSDLGVISEKN